jgi:hypothetical protein
MWSKYDSDWAARLDEISGYGATEVRWREVTHTSMAHAAPLGRAVAAGGICARTGTARN